MELNKIPDCHYLNLTYLATYQNIKHDIQIFRNELLVETSFSESLNIDLCSSGKTICPSLQQQISLGGQLSTRAFQI